MSAPTYIRERTALPSGHLQGLHLGIKLRVFNTELSNFEKRWGEFWQMWLTAHDYNLIHSFAIVTLDGKLVPVKEIDFSPDGRVIYIDEAQPEDGEGGQG